MLDKEGCLIDGRNRLRACTLAGVEPRFEVLPEGEGPVAFIRSENRNRRHAKASELALEAALHERDEALEAARTGAQYCAPSNRALAEDIGTSAGMVQMVRVLAGVEPQFTRLPEGEDPATFVRSRNRFRRQARASEMAMEAAIEDRDAEEAAQTGEIYISPSSRQLAAEIGISQTPIVMARVVLAWAPERAQDVIDGASLTQMHRIAVERKQQAEEAARTEERRRLDEASAFAALERDYPEIAARVAEEGWTVPQALAYQAYCTAAVQPI